MEKKIDLISVWEAACKDIETIQTDSEQYDFNLKRTGEMVYLCQLDEKRTLYLRVTSDKLSATMMFGALRKDITGKKEVERLVTMHRAQEKKDNYKYLSERFPNL